jgi:putative thioredoxin
MPQGKSAPVFEVTDASFQKDVLDRSAEVPVLVDFWAPWCGPCRMLGPILEQVVAEQAGSVVLAKLNTDENPATAQRYGIRGIPNVKAFVDGQVADEFQGAVPEPHVRAFVTRIAPSQHLGALDRAKKRFSEGKYEEARTLLDEIPPSDPGYPASDQLRARIDLAVEANRAGEPAFLEERLSRDASDGGARIGLATLAAAAGDFGTALTHLLAVIQGGSPDDSDTARARMLTVFRAMDDQAAVRTWQQKLAAALY